MTTKPILNVETCTDHIVTDFQGAAAPWQD